ncbi:hypothetical protein OQA88_6465 [Cercophora sp. LCS_1]
MASSSTTPDTQITVKILLDGVSRRYKLPMRDLGINVLENKLREILAIPAEAEAIFERYSDSAAAYVVLDQKNISVYKQLGRAAKAKQKLKLRVTVKLPVEDVNEAESEKRSPQPVSVEDEAEQTATPQSTEVHNAVPEVQEPTAAPSTTTIVEEMAPKLREHLASMESTLEQLQATMAATSHQIRAPSPSPCPPPAVLPCKIARTNYAVCCNSCDRTIPEVHYHCSTCDDGDFDLCQECVDQGKNCYGTDHWLIKRFVKHGVIINSTTERIAPKSKVKPQSVDQPSIPAPVSQDRIIPLFNEFLYSSIRTCNCCVQELPEVDFVHCTTCEDFDLCRSCFAKNRHGHHPKHAFVAAVEGTRLEPDVSRRLSAGRDQPHNAICDGCDEAIKGIRHKCLDCPDWDYCSTCAVNSSFIHPGHRFVPIYEPLELASDARIRVYSRPTHFGICCDGPLCMSARSNSTYIVGDRYKCAVCHDTDFCASCEASPANNHNKTHPLIKFKTPVRHVSVSTTGEHENGRLMPAMGDRIHSRTSVTSSRSTETTPQNVLFTNIQTVVDVKPSEPSPTVKAEEKEIKVEEVEAKPVESEKQPVVSEELVAVFVRDTVADGTVYGPDHVFEQTWILRNEGTTAWPAGCSVKYVGGDYMGHVDSTHPAATQDLEESCESTICYSSVAPGDEVPFTVFLRTPQRSGRVVSNWRLTTKDGLKFGHRLWCDVVVEEPTPVVPELVKTTGAAEPKVPGPHQSQMIFPKLEKESPEASVHSEPQREAAPSVDDDFEDCAEDEEWAEDSSETFMTDDEYDILDASDEEYHGEQHGKN